MTQEKFDTIMDLHRHHLDVDGTGALVDFHGHDLTGINVTGIDFTGVYLAGATGDVELTTKQVAQVLNVTVQRVGVMRKAGQLQYVKRGGRYLHPVEGIGKRQAELLAWRARMLKG